MTDLQQAKALVLRYIDAFDNAPDNQLAEVLSQFVTPDYFWRGMHPFYEQQGADAVVTTFWQPLREAFSPLQRRQDIFLAGLNDVADENDSEKSGEKSDGKGQAIWVCNMGHFLGLHDKPWLGIPPTGKLNFLRYAEFHCVVDNRITQSAFFCDILGVMQQAGHYPLPPQTGAFIMQPGPRTHDGLLTDAQDNNEGEKTMALVNRMISDLSELNVSGDDNCPPELLQRCWTDDMLWYGPTGIGSAYTIKRYQKQHQYPFRENLKDKVFNGHIARFAEGNYACFFGWANLTNTATGGFLGMTGNDTRADMRVVDVYRREGDKLAENWVFIDLLHYLSMQGLDVLERMRRSLLP